MTRSVTRRPRLRVLANGAPLAGVSEAEVVSSNHAAADRFSVAVAVAGGEAAWASAGDIALDVQMGFLPDGAAEEMAPWVSLVQGAVDSVALDVMQGVLRLDGRDYTARFIEARTQETFANRTASEIATALAARHGLSASVVATKTPVGRYYQSEHDRITLDQFSRATTEWDLLVWLAEQEGFDVWVQGTTLFFQPGVAAAAPVMVLRPDDAIDMRLERSLTLARDIEVVVKSWNSKQQAAFVQTARSNARASDDAARYVFVRPNLLPDQALKLAQAKLAEISQHERVIAVTMPGELALSPRDAVLVQATGTAFDQVYYVERIERQLRVQGGFVQRVRARNTSMASAATTPADAVMAVTG